MRALVVCGVVGVALGLAAQWVPRAPEEVASEKNVVVGGEASKETLAAPASDTAAVGVAQTSLVDGAVAGASSTSSITSTASMASPASTVSTTPADEIPPEHVAPVADPARSRMEKLLSAGFTRERAQVILQTESRLRRAAIEREYTTTGTIRPLNASTSSSVEKQLKREMTATEYETYLLATGQTTRIRIGDVESRSAAANAGMQPGDEILSYAGQRVFTPRDLNALMLQTPEGSTVKATVVRNGQTMDLYVNGGPLGVTAGVRAE